MPTTDSTDIYYLFSSFLVWFGFLRRRFFIHATARTCARYIGWIYAQKGIRVRRGNKNRQSKAVLILLIWPKYSSDFCYSVAHVSRTHHTRSHAPSAIHRMKINRKNKKKNGKNVIPLNACNTIEHTRITLSRDAMMMIYAANVSPLNRWRRKSRLVVEEK